MEWSVRRANMPGISFSEWVTRVPGSVRTRLVAASFYRHPGFPIGAVPVFKPLQADGMMAMDRYTVCRGRNRFGRM